MQRVWVRPRAQSRPLGVATDEVVVAGVQFGRVELILDRARQALRHGMRGRALDLAVLGPP
jgi:hypothetical protein